MERFTIDQKRLERACRDAGERQTGDVCGNGCDGIGTMREKLLHAALKNYFSGEEDLPEQKVGRHVVDLLGPDGATEIQTGSLFPLKKKIGALLDEVPVTVVCPVMRRKTLCWIDPLTAEVSPGRKSPKKGAAWSLLPELLYLAPWIGREDFTVVIFLYDGVEYRLKNGWGKDGKRGSERFERHPERAVDLIVLQSRYDCGALLPENCPPKFSSAEFAKRTGFGGRKCWAALKFLCEVGVLEKNDDARPQTYTVTNKEFLVDKDKG